MVRSAIVAFALAVGLAGGAAAQHAPELEPANNNIANTASLQRGAKYFVNYCMGCHSAKYVRYNRLGEDLQLSNQQLIDNLMFTGERPFDTMSIAMKPEDSKRWFSISPPDLSLIARSRGTDYIYTNLHSLYVDLSRPTGVNNNVLTVSGVREEEQKEEGATFHRVERRSGSFSRSVALPVKVADEKVDAKFRNGVLTVSMQKLENGAGRKIKVQS